MKVVLLISCMHQKDADIIRRSNVQTDVVVVNQCDKDSVEEFDFSNIQGETCHAKFINTRERGLSRSRNMAIANAWGDICLISDDDERFEDDYENKIITAYKENPTAGFVSFACVREGISYSKQPCRMGILQILKTSSIQITFKRQEILKHKILFDVIMGSGTGNGAGEENRFMMDCRKADIEMLYNPAVITTLLSANSQWNNGLDEKYFRNRGWASRRILGTGLGYLFIWYNIFSNRKRFINGGLSLAKIICYFHKGFFERRS